MLRLYKSLLRLRRIEPVLDLSSPQLEISALDDDTLLLKREVFWAVIRFRGHGDLDLGGKASLPDPVWSSEDLQFAPDSRPIQVDQAKSQVRFSRPGAIVFRSDKKEEAR